MLSQTARDFILHITNYFHGHWEDPEWGRMPVNQLLVGLAIRELAQGIQDVEIRGHIQTAADKAIAKNSQLVARH
ncbi:hypothetical protein LPB67_07355 [Undibacterium sp. Jales W-56]|uniref:hypothetical protein n=1 Tax=Undibacterium sp. Jales W-56 TaxID=2897325 RepID=UPI0021D26F5B|nr:hypothetical protein [Undibacterium sp. Jales W-56]MCU6433592.1 hypothetical protein [Undibacterium sp. Jales W-56]